MSTPENPRINQLLEQLATIGLTDPWSQCRIWDKFIELTRASALGVNAPDNQVDDHVDINGCQPLDIPEAYIVLKLIITKNKPLQPEAVEWRASQCPYIPYVMALLFHSPDTPIYKQLIDMACSGGIIWAYAYRYKLTGSMDDLKFAARYNCPAAMIELYHHEDNAGHFRNSAKILKNYAANTYKPLSAVLSNLVIRYQRGIGVKRNITTAIKLILQYKLDPVIITLEKPSTTREYENVYHIALSIKNKKYRDAMMDILHGSWWLFYKLTAV